MTRKLFCSAIAGVFVLGLVAVFSTPASAGRCRQDPSPNGRDHCAVKCPPCSTLVCVHGGKCGFICEPIPGCVDPLSTHNGR